uniref:Stc1 domain protein n=1 Tax=Pithovirus LCPAC403 TaxID=2506596 RepID=A0A481ZB30_9VIRU|nr:MAG: Stc1 domain protein [Pithovirus LCPAC403]
MTGQSKLCGRQRSRNKGPCKQKLRNGKCYIHEDNVVRCGSTDTADGKSCGTPVILDGDRCHFHSVKEEDVTERVCTSCKQIKPLEDFSKNINGKYERASQCKECVNEVNNERQTSGDKICNICKLSKHVSFFGTNGHAKDGLRASCINCESIKDATRHSTLDGFANYLMRGVRSRDEACKIDEKFIIDQYEEQKHVCPGTGFQMRHLKTYDPDQLARHSDISWYNMSPDRIDPSIEYLKLNVQMTTWGYNNIKGERKEKIMVDMCQDIISFQKRTEVPKRVKISSIEEQFFKEKRDEAQTRLDKMFREIDIKFTKFCNKCTDRSDLIEEERKHLYRRSMTVDITLKQLYKMFEKQGGRCALSGRKLTTYTASVLRPGEKRSVLLETNHYNISLDRIDSTEGYNNDNVQIVCSIINAMKMDMPQPLFIKFADVIGEIAYIPEKVIIPEEDDTTSMKDNIA